MTPLERRPYMGLKVTTPEEGYSLGIVCELLPGYETVQVPAIPIISPSPGVPKENKKKKRTLSKERLLTWLARLFLLLGLGLLVYSAGVDAWGALNRQVPLLTHGSTDCVPYHPITLYLHRHYDTGATLLIDQNANPDIDLRQAGIPHNRVVMNPATPLLAEWIVLNPKRSDDQVAHYLFWEHPELLADYSPEPILVEDSGAALYHRSGIPIRTWQSPLREKLPYCL